MKRALWMAPLALLAPAACPASAGPVARTVLGVYRAEQIPDQSKDFYFHPLHLHAEMPLNYLGLSLEPLEESGPLPDPAALPDVRGVVSWWPAPDSLPDPDRYCRWLSRGMKAGWKVVILGELGVYPKGSEKLSAACSDMLKTLGVEGGGSRSVDALTAQAARSLPLMGFERKPDVSERGFVPLLRALPGSSSQFDVKLDDARWPKTSPVVLTPRGGAALAPFLLYQNEQLDPPQYRWIIDPFAFLDAAFGNKGLPRPDVTTLSGRRVFMTHVDGDGFFNMSEIDKSKTSGEIFLREFLERWPDTPFTMSLIAGYYDMELYNDEQSMELSRRVLRRPNVEPAAHGYAHPMIWRSMKKDSALKIPGYTPNPARETVEAARILSNLFLPSGRRIGLYLWTGDCLPSAGTEALLARAGLLQMNGGGGRFDDRYPSYAYLFPLSRRLGRWRQVYAGDSNDNDYIGGANDKAVGAEGAYYGYREVLKTFERSGAPRRVKPVDVYVHYFSAQRYASLRALRQVYDWARSQPLIPIFAGRYARAVQDFFAMSVERLGPRRFLLRGGPAVRTVRFDDESLVPDMDRSRGVIGWKREGRALYVSLDESGEREVTLARHPAPRPRLEEANFEVERWRREGGGVSFFKQGWWKSEFVLADLRPECPYRVESPGFQRTLISGRDGRLRVTFPDSERGRPAAQVTVKPA